MKYSQWKEAGCGLEGQQEFSGLEQQYQEWELHMVLGAHNSTDGKAQAGPQRFQQQETVVSEVLLDNGPRSSSAKYMKHKKHKWINT
jgi:hypothetical protein